jgi:hypothetical protein
MVYFDTFYQADSVKYFITVPKAKVSDVKQRLKMSWPECLLEETKLPGTEGVPEVAEVRYLHNDIFSFRTDTRDNDPMTSQLSVLEGLREGDVYIGGSYCNAITRMSRKQGV